MRNTDPIAFFQDHRETIFFWSGVAGGVLVLYLILRFFAMRLGGWTAAWRRVCREVALTAYAFSWPVRAWIRYRRSVAALIRLLGTASTWRDAEHALVAAKLEAFPAQPYAAVVGARTVTVLFAALTMPTPQGIWREVPGEPTSWTAARTELPSVTPDTDGRPPVIVALGETDHNAVFLDLAVGPPILGVDGERRASTALFQAIAVQVDARLPGGQVVVADGVHRDVPGPMIRDAYRTARATPPRLGLPAFLATPELPAPLPPELAEPPLETPPLRIVLRGAGRGFVRTALTDKHGRVAVPGTPVVATGNGLGAALTRILADIPPVLPPAPAGLATPGSERQAAYAEAAESSSAEWALDEESRAAEPAPAHELDRGLAEAWEDESADEFAVSADLTRSDVSTAAASRAAAATAVREATATAAAAGMSTSVPAARNAAGTAGNRPATTRSTVPPAPPAAPPADRTDEADRPDAPTPPSDERAPTDAARSENGEHGHATRPDRSAAPAPAPDAPTGSAQDEESARPGTSIPPPPVPTDEPGLPEGDPVLGIPPPDGEPFLGLPPPEWARDAAIDDEPAAPGVSARGEPEPATDGTEPGDAPAAPPTTPRRPGSG